MIFSFITAIAIVTSVALCLYAIALLLKDNSIMDIAYGIVFMIIGAALYGMVPDASIAQKLLMLFLFAWGIRLSLRIYLRKIGKGEDFRYRAWREEWLLHGTAYFYLRTLFQVFVLQGIIILIVSLPIVLGLSSVAAAEPWVFMLGTSLFAIGYFFEALADYQLDRFTKDPANKGSILSHGLFRYSRRPNYFGESMIWWGMACMAASMLDGVWVYLVFISPITITYILLFVTGPMLERKFMTDPAYRKYAAITSYFVPLPPRGK